MNTIRAILVFLLVSICVWAATRFATVASNSTTRASRSFADEVICPSLAAQLREVR